MVCLTFYKFHTNVSLQFSPIEFRSKSTVPKTSPITTEFLTGFVLICSIILGNLKCCSLFSLTTDDNKHRSHGVKEWKHVDWRRYIQVCFTLFFLTPDTA